MLSCKSDADPGDTYTRVIEGTGAKQRRRACIKIQASIRRYLARNHYLLLLARIAAATKIQAIWRRYLALRAVGPALEQARADLEETWNELKHKLATSWSILQSRPQVVLHLQSYGYRKSVVEGTSVYVRVDFGGRRIIKKKTKKT